MDKVRIGVLSHAHGHSNAYCRKMLEFDDVELVACWDDNEDRGREAAAAFGMDYRSDSEAVIADPDIDAVIVTTETNRHAEFVEQAAAAGKAVLCQKPLATTLEDCDRIIEAVRRTGVKFSVAFQMRQDPVNRKIKELVDAGAVGEVAVVRRRHCIGVLNNEGFFTGPTRWHVDPVANVGMFFDDFNFVPLTAVLGKESIEDYRTRLRDRERVETAMQFYESRPDLSREQILATWDDEDGTEVGIRELGDPVALSLQAKVRSRAVSMALVYSEPLRPHW